MSQNGINLQGVKKDMGIPFEFYFTFSDALYCCSYNKWGKFMQFYAISKESIGVNELFSIQFSDDVVALINKSKNNLLIIIWHNVYLTCNNLCINSLHYNRYLNFDVFFSHKAESFSLNLCNQWSPEWTGFYVSYLLRLIGTFHLVYKRQCVLGSCQFEWSLVLSTLRRGALEWIGERELWRRSGRQHLQHCKFLLAFYFQCPGITFVFPTLYF